MTELDCAFCPEPIAAGQNHTTNPPAHIHCAHERGHLGNRQPAETWLTGPAMDLIRAVDALDVDAGTRGRYEPNAMTRPTGETSASSRIRPAHTAP